MILSEASLKDLQLNRIVPLKFREPVFFACLMNPSSSDIDFSAVQIQKNMEARFLIETLKIGIYSKFKLSNENIFKS